MYKIHRRVEVETDERTRLEMTCLFKNSCNGFNIHRHLGQIYSQRRTACYYATSGRGSI